jgi:hypothetical protein
MARVHVAWRNPNWLLPFSCNVRPIEWATKVSAVSEHSRVGVSEWEKGPKRVRRLLRESLIGTVSRSPPPWRARHHLSKPVQKYQ